MKIIYIFISFFIFFFCGCKTTVPQSSYAISPEMSFFALPWKSFDKSKLPHAAADYFKWIDKNILSSSQFPEDMPATLRKAQEILDNAILAATPKSPDVEILQNLRILHDHQAFMWNAHATQVNNTEDAHVMEKQVAKSQLLQTVRNENKTLFASWLHILEQWERQNNDWSGIQWAGIIGQQKIVAILQDIWLARVDSLSQGLNENWNENSMDAWRKNNPLPLKINEDWSKQIQNNGAPVWIMQEIAMPAKTAKEPFTLNFREFPGRCVIYVDTVQVFRKEEFSPCSFGIPLVFNEKNNFKCHVVIHLPDGFPRSPAKWHPWVASAK